VCVQFCPFQGMYASPESFLFPLPAPNIQHVESNNSTRCYQWEQYQLFCFVASKKFNT